MIAAQRLARLLDKPVFAVSFPLPAPPRIDARLVGGAALFGVGWGLSGFCPGPALVSFGALTRQALVFVAAMAAGMALFHALGAADRSRAAKPVWVDR
jgi:hypothetical protein